MDIRMPGLDGIEAVRQILSAPETVATRVVMLTTFETDENVFAALRAGAAGFLVKDTDLTDLLRAVRLAASGESLLSPSVTRRVIESLQTAGAVPAAATIPGSATLPIASAKCSRSSARASTTPRSLSAWWSVPPQPVPTSAGS